MPMHLSRPFIQQCYIGRPLESDDVVADLLRRQSWRYRGLDEVKVKRRMLGYLSRRGYDRELANRAAGKIWQEIRDNDIAGD